MSEDGGATVGPGPSSTALSPTAGLGLVAFCAVLFFGGGLALAGSDPVWSLSLLPVCAFLVPSVLCARVLRAEAVAFPHGKPTRDAWAIFASFTLGASLLALAIAGWIVRLTGPSEEEALMAEFVARYALPQRVVLFALLPALCEESLFRGVLLASLKRWGILPACLTSALLFALFHGSPLRLAPVAILGAALAAIVWTTRNVWLAAGGHALHNLLVLGAAQIYGASSGPSTGALALWAVAGLVLIALGAWRARRGSPARGGSEQ